MKANSADIRWHSDLSIYASEAFLRTAGDDYGWVGGYDQAGTLRCILPYTITRKATVCMARFRTETIPVGDPLMEEEEKAFLNSVVEYFRGRSVDLIIPATTNAVFKTYPDRALAAPYGTQMIDLTRPEETLWNNLHSKHRNVIRNASKKGVQVHWGMKYLAPAHDLIRETFKRSNMGFMSYAAFEKMVLGLGENVRIFGAELNGALQGCAVIPFSSHTAYYVYGGTTAEPLTGATNLLQWEAIRQFHGMGVKRYDFCGVRINPEKGSKAAGLMMYKERFGPDLIQGFIWKCTIRPLKAAVYSLAVRLARGGDIVDAERRRLKGMAKPALEIS